MIGGGAARTSPPICWNRGGQSCKQDIIYAHQNCSKHAQCCWYVPESIVRSASARAPFPKARERTPPHAAQLHVTTAIPAHISKPLCERGGVSGRRKIRCTARCTSVAEGCHRARAGAAAAVQGDLTLGIPPHVHCRLCFSDIGETRSEQREKCGRQAIGVVAAAVSQAQHHACTYCIPVNKLYTCPSTVCDHVVKCAGRRGIDKRRVRGQSGQHLQQ